MSYWTLEQPNIKQRLLAGFWTGLLSSLVTGIYFIVISIFMKEPKLPLLGLNRLANSIGVHWAMVHPVLQVLTGFCLYLVIAACLGILWGAVITRTPTAKGASLIGVTYGLLCFWIVHAFANAMHLPITQGVQPLIALIGFIIFGLCFAAYPQLVHNPTFWEFINFKEEKL